MSGFKCLGCFWRLMELGQMVIAGEGRGRKTTFNSVTHVHSISDLTRDVLCYIRLWSYIE